jgi:hypothetical protein
MVYMTLSRKRDGFYAVLTISAGECSFWTAFAQRNRFAIMLIDAA